MNKKEKKWDVFIAHASEDKQFVRPIATALNSLGVDVWYDEFSLKYGDSLSRSIDKGLAGSKYGLLVISQNFFKKRWAEYELRGLVAREMEEDKLIIPVWLGVDRIQVLNYSPSLADKYAITTEGKKAEDVLIEVLRAVRPDIYKKHPRSKLERIASGDAIKELQKELEHAQEELAETKEQLSEYLCPYCSAPLSESINAPADPEATHWGVREVYACGYQHFGGCIECPCPADPKFPKFEEYELKFHYNPKGAHLNWECQARPKTYMARLLRLPMGYGRTKKEAETFIRENYAKYARRYE